MCPVCVASAAAWVVGGTVSTSGITALAVRVLGSKKKRESGTSTKKERVHAGLLSNPTPSVTTPAASATAPT